MSIKAQYNEPSCLRSAFNKRKDMFPSLQRVPAFLSNGNITRYWINYTLMGTPNEEEPTSSPCPAAEFTYEIGLRENLVYRFIVDGETEAGVNTSLTHKPIIISTMKNTGNIKSFFKIVSSSVSIIAMYVWNMYCVIESVNVFHITVCSLWPIRCLFCLWFWYAFQRNVQ